VLIMFGDKIRSQTKPFLYLFQLGGAKDPVHDGRLAQRNRPHTATHRIMTRPTGNSGYQRPLGHDLFAIVRIRFAIRTYGPTAPAKPNIREMFIQSTTKVSNKIKKDVHCPI
ncbi:hypothetical protein SJS43_13360, partial [Aeromonas caviae]|uniref:hypothetical protein n=1 Tax=Aeromonas caviae TaxID=648 RepID=UPI0029DA113D